MAVDFGLAFSCPACGAVVWEGLAGQFNRWECVGCGTICSMVGSLMAIASTTSWVPGEEDAKMRQILETPRPEQPWGVGNRLACEFLHAKRAPS